MVPNKQSSGPVQFLDKGAIVCKHVKMLSWLFKSHFLKENLQFIQVWTTVLLLQYALLDYMYLLNVVRCT